MYLVVYVQVDAFTKNTAVLLVVLVGIITASAYFGSQVGGLEGTDGIVEDMAAESGQRMPVTPITLDQTGEHIGFALAGVLSGLVVGYVWPFVFYRRPQNV